MSKVAKLLKVEPELNPVRHTTQPYYHFLNTDVFREAAIHFDTHGVYTFAIDGTLDHKEFWDREEDRIVNGMEVDGIRITGQHYFYLNYLEIERTVKLDNGLSIKRLGFPDFLAMDYYYFHEVEIARYAGEGMIIAKARRKGFSYKNAAILAWYFHFIPDSVSILGAFEQAWWELTFDMAYKMVNFVNDHTDFNKRFGKESLAQGRLKFGYKEKDEYGNEILKGYNTEIICITFRQGAQKAIGKSASVFLFEEAGDWPGLKEAYRRSYATFRDGEIMIGQPIIYGTGGNSKHNEDFQSMFYNPSAFGLRSYKNIYDQHVEGEAGWFVDDTWYRPPFVDLNGNALFEEARESVLAERIELQKTDPADYNMVVTQHPLSPKEAFLRPEGSIFPAIELNEVLARLIADKRYANLGTPGYLTWTKDKDNLVTFTPDLNNEIVPLTDYRIKPGTPLRGGVVIYETPRDTNLTTLYKIGYDTIYHDNEGGRSLAAIYVYKGVNKLEHGYDEIVACYVGRRDNSDEINDICLKLSIYYNFAKVMVENNRAKDTFAYFKRKGYFDLLADQPDSVINKHIKNSTVNRIKGCHMNDQLKTAAEKFTLRWLLTERGTNQNGELVRNMDLIPDKGLIQELIAYNRDGNFDRVMAFFQIMISIEEDIEKPIVSENIGTDFVNQMLAQTQNFYRR